MLYLKLPVGTSKTIQQKWTKTHEKSKNKQKQSRHDTSFIYFEHVDSFAFRNYYLQLLVHN